MGLSLVQEHGAHVGLPVGLACVHRLEEHAVAGDAVGIAGDVVEADGLHRPSPPRVDPAVRRFLHEALRGQLSEHVADVRRREDVFACGFEGKLGHGAQQLPREDVGVGKIDDGLLVGLSEEGLGVLHQILVERVLKAHKDGQGVAVAAARPARLLPRGKHRPRVARDDDAVERADVDAHLEGVGRGDPREEAPLESVLDLAALLGKVACPVGGDLPGKGRSGCRRFLRPQGDELRHSSRCREAQRLQAPLDEDRERGPSSPGGARGCPPRRRRGCRTGRSSRHGASRPRR